MASTLTYEFKQDVVDHRFFRNFVLTVLVYIALYSSVYFYFGARLSGCVLLVGGLVFTPGILFLDKVKFQSTARFIFCLSCLIYIYATIVGIKERTDASYYYLAALMIPVLLFDTKQKFLLIFCALLGPIFWCLSVWGPRPQLSDFWIPSTFPGEAFQIINFFGSNLIIVLFLKFFLDRISGINNLIHTNSERQEYILEGAGLGAWDWWLETNKVNFDRRWCEMLGLNPDNTPNIFETWESRVHLDDKKKAYEDIDDYLSGKTLFYENIHRMKHSNGSWVWILDRGRVSGRDANGKPIRFSGTHFNITKLKEAEILSEDVQRLAKIGGWELELSSQNVFWTNESFRIYDLPIGTKINKNICVKYFALHEHEKLERLINESAAGEAFKGIFEFYDSAGKHKWIEITGVPIFNVEGKVYKIRGTIQDITLIKEYEYKLEEAQRLAKIGSWSYQILDQRLDCSKQIYSLFPILESNPPQDLDALIQLLPSADQDAFKKSVQSASSTGQSEKFRHKSEVFGKTLWLETFINCELNSQGEVVRLFGTCQDITELVDAEERTRNERAKAVQSTKLASLGEMAAGIAHEINNPLAIISGAVNLLDKKYSHMEDLTQKIITIQKSTERIAKIVSGLRKFARSSEKNKHRTHLLKDIVKEAVMLAEVKARRNSVPIEFQSESDARVNCDEIEIEQVVINLINNSIDAVRELPDKWVRLELLDSKDSVFLRVIDSGAGISEDAEKKIFQPFFTTKPVGEGTGLGLSISKGILDDHNASIEFKMINSNTCFELKFNKEP